LKTFSKIRLQQLADGLDLPSQVAHFPPGTGKWSKIEHRLFAFITQNRRARPWVSHEVIVNLIASTTNGKGLKMRCELDTNTCPAGIKISPEEVSKVRLTPPMIFMEAETTPLSQILLKSCNIYFVTNREGQCAVSMRVAAVARESGVGN
jgi:hypothetical protein